jgi:hypothetical protein
MNYSHKSLITLGPDHQDAAKDSEFARGVTFMKYFALRLTHWLDKLESLSMQRK